MHSTRQERPARCAVRRWRRGWELVLAPGPVLVLELELELWVQAPSLLALALALALELRPWVWALVLRLGDVVRLWERTSCPNCSC